MYLRAYRPADLDALFRLDKTCFDPPFRFSRAAMRRFAEAPNSIVRLCCSSDGEETSIATPERLLGFCIISLETNAGEVGGYVVTLDIEPAERRRGLARLLLSATEAVAHSAGAQLMGLHVFAQNHSAIRLYEALGYRLVGTAGNFYGRQLHALAYRKDLPSPTEAAASAPPAGRSSSPKGAPGRGRSAS